MQAELNIPYIDRASGSLLKESVYADRFLRWSYNASVGLLLPRFCLSRPLCSRMYGWYNRQSWTRHRIARFIHQMHIDSSELVEPLDSFSSFAAFFTRTIDAAARPIAPDPRACVAPVDSKVLAYQSVSAATPLQVKRHQFTIPSLLNDERLAVQYDGGSVVIFRLTLADYHHFHFPDSGTARAHRKINGSLFAGGPYANRFMVPFYSENLRMLTMFASDHFGTILMVEVGAFTVGSICQAYTPGKPVTKGEHKGYFELGGSTVVLLFQPGTIVLDQDLTANTRQGLETSLHMGERIGMAREMES